MLYKIKYRKKKKSNQQQHLQQEARKQSDNSVDVTNIEKQKGGKSNGKNLESKNTSSTEYPEIYTHDGETYL